MADEKKNEMNEETVEEKKGLAKAWEKTTGFFKKPIVKKITTGIAVGGAAVLGYIIGAACGSKDEGVCEDTGYLPDPGTGIDGNNGTECTDNYENDTIETYEEEEDATNESEGSAE